jgi:hypothetical protein
MADGPTTSTPAAGLGERIKGWIDTLLVIDVFVVIAGAIWFGVAVVCHSRSIEAPLTLFQTLWEPLFTPAIGLLMGAALLSGALSWWQRRGQR